MPIYSGYPATGAKDYDDYSVTNAILSATTDGTSTVTSSIYAILNTSAVTTGGTITAATIDWWITNDCRAVQVEVDGWNGSSWVVLRTPANGSAANRYMTTAITASSQLACINAYNGGSETYLKLTVAGVSKFMGVRAYESGTTGQLGAIRIGVRYNDPVASGVNNRRRIMIIE
jgi:hypothetical protein